MEELELLRNPTIQEIVNQYNLTKLLKLQNGYNLFTISSYNSYLENFHSDIIASLLDPNGLHNQGYSYLHLFLDFLNINYQTKLSNEEFRNTIVSRETGRLDIWIRDEISHKSIIIENKINNAPDMEKQIDRYFEYAEFKNKYPVQAVVYLTIDGTKKAPKTIEDIGHLVKNIGAFTNSESKVDLVTGWLNPCLMADSNTLDSKSVIHQYIKLIQHLANENMDAKTMEDFYRFLGTTNSMANLNAIAEMNGNLGAFRARRFSDSIPNHEPFGKQYWYYPYYLVYYDFVENQNDYKLDIWFEGDGSACVLFWNPGNETESSREFVKAKLESIELFNEFIDDKKYETKGYIKYFKIGDIFNSLTELDNSLIEFVKEFLRKLQITKH